MIKKNILIFCSAIFLTSCAQSTAFLVPAITIGSGGGNVYQAGLSYGSNVTIEQTTGKSPSKHIAEYVDKKNQKIKRTKEFKKFLKTHIETTRKKIIIRQ